LTRRSTKRVLVVGSITRDTNVFDGVATHTYGGTTLYAARTYAQFGVAVRVVTRLAPDDCAAIAAELPGAEVIAQPSDVTTTFENSYGRDDSRTQRVRDVAAPIEHRVEYLDDIDWLHLGPLHPLDLDHRWIEVEWRVPTGLDLQGFVRQIVGGRVESSIDARVVELLPRLEWLKASRNEWHALLAHMGLDRSSRPDTGAIESLVTDGVAGGSLLRTGERDEHWSAAPPVEDCDPTGAGDVFFAAYLRHRAVGASASAAARDAARVTSSFLLKRRDRD